MTHDVKVGGNMARKMIEHYSKHEGTERLQIEHALLSAMNDGLIVADIEGQVIWINTVAGRLLGQDAETAVGKSVRPLFKDALAQGHVTVQDALNQLYADPYLQSSNTGMDEVILELDMHVLKVRLLPMFTEVGEFLGIEILIQDMTAQAEVDRERSEFVSNVSHELRRPLTAIKGYSDLLLFSGIGPLNAQQEHFLRIVQDNADRLVALANDLLDISHIQSGRLQLDQHAVQVENIIRDVTKRMQTLCDKRDVHLALKIDPHIWTVWGDANRLAQVTQNLILHAIRSTPEGGEVTVSVSCSEKAVRVDVTDTGPGIPSEEQSRLFKYFYRVNNPTLTEGAGTGLGLPIAKQLIEMHGGGLLIDSKVGEGSTFTFVLPRQDSGRSTGTTTVTDQDLSQDQRTTVMVVEDERDISELIALQLRSEGYEVLTTARGEQALAWTKEHQIDLITLDMMLPDITGMEVLRRLKADNATADIPVIVVSVIQPKMGGPAWGATEHISKPFALDKLMSSVRRILANAKRGRLTPVTVVEPEGVEV